MPRRYALLLLLALILLMVGAFVSEIANGVYASLEQERATVAARGTTVMSTLEILWTATP